MSDVGGSPSKLFGWTSSLAQYKLGLDGIKTPSNSNKNQRHERGRWSSSLQISKGRMLTISLDLAPQDLSGWLGSDTAILPVLDVCCLVGCILKVLKAASCRSVGRSTAAQTNRRFQRNSITYYHFQPHTHPARWTTGCRINLPLNSRLWD